jgi:hypothetical protein
MFGYKVNSGNIKSNLILTFETERGKSEGWGIVSKGDREL